MSKISASQFKDWNNGDVIFEADYEKEREILRVAINDNYDLIITTYTKGEINPQNGDGTPNFSVVGVLDSRYYNKPQVDSIIAAIEAGVKMGTAFPTTHIGSDLFYRTDENKLYLFNGTGWIDLAADTRADDTREFRFEVRADDPVNPAIGRAWINTSVV